ncbi:MAG: M14 family metallopeptidase [Campylobacterota bacterium]|nr:M14 family metallopeptidase [Campylobacterota bacterium]
MIPLIEIDTVPEGLLTIEDARELHKLMPHPTLMHLEGERKAPLFVTVLLHGNEDTGLFAIQKILRKYQERPLPRSMIIFFGNIYASREGLRRLEGQPDYNRVWPGGEAEDSDEGRLIERVMQIVTEADLFASIDIHNNTGKNPHYGCINKLSYDFLQLASLFARTVVYFETPRGVQSLALAEYCPAVTIECGKPHLAQGIDHATEFVDTLLHMTEFPHHNLRSYEVDVYHTVARVTIPEVFSYSYSDENADIRLFRELENDNFSELPAGTVFAHVKPACRAHFLAQDDEGAERTDNYFVIEDEQIKLRKPMMPSMITLDEHVIRQDCFCYLMERIALPGW